MTKPGKYLFIILVALLVIGWLACTQARQPCETPLTASLNMEMEHLISVTDSTFVDTVLPGAEFIPITRIPNRAPDTDIYPPGTLFTLSLSPIDTMCQWAFTTDSAKTGTTFDTFTFYYQRSLQFVSNSCGYTYFYNIDTVVSTHHNIDSIHILSKGVTNNVNTTQLQICIHPDYF